MVNDNLIVGGMNSGGASTEGGKKRNDASAMFLCPASKRRCLILHIEGVKPQNLIQQSALRRWSDSTETISTFIMHLHCCCFSVHK